MSHHRYEFSVIPTEKEIENIIKKHCPDYPAKYLPCYSHVISVLIHQQSIWIKYEHHIPFLFVMINRKN